MLKVVKVEMGWDEKSHRNNIKQILNLQDWNVDDVMMLRRWNVMMRRN